MEGRVRPDEIWGGQTKVLKLKRKEVVRIEALLRDGSTPQRIARRARILLACSQGEGVVATASKLDFDRSTVWRMWERYRQGGLGAALYDAQRSGRPQVFPPKHPTSHRKPGL